MNDRFIFSVIFTDVQKQSEVHSFQVLAPNCNQPDARMIKLLNDLDKSIYDNPGAICENQHFDLIYSCIKAFSQNIQSRGMRVLQKLADTVHLITKTILKQAQRVTNIPENGNYDIRNCFKMAIFIALYFIYSTTLRKAKGPTDILGGMLNKQKKRKPRNQINQISEVTVNRQKMIIQLLKQSLYVNYEALFEKKQVDSEFFKKYCQISVKILESNLVKDQQTLGIIFEILETIIKAQPELFNNIRIVLINLVYESEIIDNLVNFFSKAESAELQRLCTQTIITVVIYLVQKTGLNAEASSIKNTKQFLSKLSQRIPKTFYNNLQCFIKLYEHESYILRNAISDILLNIIRNVLNLDSEENKKAKQRFITTLLQRIFDKNSFCRSYVLNILGTLAEESLVPKKFFTLFLKAGIDRVKDVSINVRKKALQLINIIIDKICTQSSRSLEQIEKDLELSELTLKTLAEQQNSLKVEIDNLQDEERIEELIGQMKLMKKNLKHEEQKEISLLEQKQVLNLVDITINNVKLLLGSKNQSDVLQTIKLFVKLYRLKFKKSLSILPQIRLLVFSKQKKIRDEVLTTFIHLHLTKKSEDVAKQLISLFTEAIMNNKEDLLSLEEIVEIIISQSLQKNIIIIKPHVYAHMWNQFIHYQRNDSNIEQKRAIITILRTAFTKDPVLIKDENMDSFLNILKSYIEHFNPDFYLLKEISRIICLQHEKIVKVSKNFLVAQILILVNCLGSNDNEWYSACENILTCIFKISQNPEKLGELFLKKLNEKLESVRTQKAMAQFIFTLSHTCLKTLIHLDTIENKIKSIRHEGEKQEQMEEQLDKVMGGMEAQLQKKIQSIQLLSQKILEDPFIKKWVELIEDIVKKFQNGNEIQVIAVLSYCKFMCLSPSYCERKIQPILDLLIRPNINSVVKNNIIISMGDLLHRFPNIVQPYNHYLYRNLQDKDVGVRKTTLTVLTHLSLNDMIKVRGDLCDIALLFRDQNSQIQGLVKHFFYELNKKDPKIIFNLIPDALTRFSNQQKFFDEVTFTAFLENIMPLMEKQKYSDSLVLKLCERISNSLNLLQIKNAAFCLSEISINQKGLRKILENFDSIKKTLQTTQVSNSFKNLVQKLKKFVKSQLKPLVDQLEQKVNTAHEQVFNPEEIRRKNLQRQQLKQKKQRKPAVLNKNAESSKKTQRKKPAARRNRMRSELDQQDQEQMDVQYNDSQEQPSSRRMIVAENEKRPNNKEKSVIQHQSIARNKPKRNRPKMEIIQQDDQQQQALEAEESYNEDQ